MNPLTANDPARLNGHRVLGRLGEGGQGVVYLGESSDGTRVAIKVLTAGLDDPDARERFEQEIGFARRVKAFCTARVLASGEYAGTPYVVSEYVAGPSLAQVIRERGTLHGAELRRLAIGTLTALAAIHRAGVVHRDFKPGNVLLGRDGPRVIDFGISRALEESEPGEDFLAGTPPYMAPEQFDRVPVGPEADLFAWASTMVCAVSGRPPFGTGPLSFLVPRIRTGEPELGGLDGELRELVVRCLAKDPAARPSATRALLTLLGHDVPSTMTEPEQRLLAEGRQSARPATSGPDEPFTASPALRRRALQVAGAAAVAVAVAAAIMITRPTQAPSATLSATPPLKALPTARQGRLALASTSELKLPGTGITLHENPADPVWVSSYHDKRDGEGRTMPAYARDPATGTFAFFGNWEEPVISPGGAYVASLSDTRLQRQDHETIRLRERSTGQDRHLRTVDKPAALYAPTWADDGRRLLLTVYDKVEAPSTSVGFVIVDAVTGIVNRTEAEGGGGVYAWGVDSKTVLHETKDGTIRVLDPNGRARRTFPGKGELLPGGARRTTLGTVFATKCTGEAATDVCFWDEGTGQPKGTIKLEKGSSFSGWLDDEHIMITATGAKRTEVLLADVKGRSVRVLADGPAAELAKVALWFTRR
ncbi:serine/threonine-protein kinase [Nonomuraea sp. NPDC050404]|uniref:serine/threonine-protein kinase n=1 Tax=Nonomuraea sp. NPDC050404 TaxID=3155783 RepID=UPI0033EEB83F